MDLMEIVRYNIAKEKGFIAKLAAAVGKDTQTVKRWIRVGRIPNPHDRFIAARQCGYSEADAVALSYGSEYVAKKAS